MKIKNVDKLLSEGDTTARKVVLEIIDSSLQALDSYPLIRSLVAVSGDKLRIGSKEWDLSSRRRIFVIGAGKACNTMARALEDVLGERIYKGLVIVKNREPGDELQRIEIVVGGHPIPNEAGLRATHRILKMVEEATPEDLFIGLISGGSSALMSCPVPEIPFEDEVKLTEELLKCGARILEINALRRHISQTNGGRLAQRIESKGAEMVNLIISDSVGRKANLNPSKPAKFFGTPVAPDGTTLEDARGVIKKYDLQSRIPRSILEYLQGNEPRKETPKSFSSLIHHFVIESPSDACRVAESVSKKFGLKSLILTTLLEGESREAGIFLSAIAKEVILNHRPIPPPCVLIAGGETTTRVEGELCGGGPSQELALGFAIEVSGKKGVCIGAVDTDGTDGPTDIAGALADGTTVKRAMEKGLDPYEILKQHESYKLVKAIGDGIITGNTGTNVCDLNVIYIGSNGF